MPVLADAVAAPTVVDQFPARVTGPNGIVYDKTRAVLTAELLIVYGRPSRQIETVLVVRYTERTPIQGVWHVTAVDGGLYQIGSGKNCGCGSPLKSMPAPYPVFLNVEPYDV